MPPVPPGLLPKASLNTEPFAVDACPGYWGPVVPPFVVEKFWQVCDGCPVVGAFGSGFAGKCGSAAKAGAATPNMKPPTSAKVRNNFLMSASPRGFRALPRAEVRI